MTKLVSGKEKVLSAAAAQAVSDRYEFINLSLAEPNLGTSDVEGYVLSYDSTAPGGRRWVAAPAQGTSGSQGPQGPQGAIGAQGIQGFNGSQGTSGTDGGSGTPGAQGAIGAQGIQGIQGVPGTGSQGTAGTAASQGATGAQGSQGTQGIAGTGSQGTAGTAASQGATGSTGSQGIQGIQGLIGIQGASGGGAGTITGSGAAGQVAVWTSASNITGYTNFTFNNGTGTATATDFNSTSDQRLKKDIRKVVDALKIVEGIDGVYYKWRDDRINKFNQVGVLANQVKEVLPEAVQMMENGYYSVSYDKLVPVLIEALKELSQRVAELESNQTK